MFHKLISKCYVGPKLTETGNPVVLSLNASLATELKPLADFFEADDLGCLYFNNYTWAASTARFHPNMRALEQGFLMLNGSPIQSDQPVGLDRQNVLAIGRLNSGTAEIGIEIIYKTKMLFRVAMLLALTGVCLFLFSSLKNLSVYHQHTRQAELKKNEQQFQEAFQELEAAAAFKKEHIPVLSSLLNEDEKLRQSMDTICRKLIFSQAITGICPDAAFEKLYDKLRLTDQERSTLHFICGYENAISQMLALVLSDNLGNDAYKQFLQYNYILKVDKGLWKIAAGKNSNQEFDFTQIKSGYLKHQKTLESLIKLRLDFNREARAGIVSKMSEIVYDAQIAFPELESRNEAFVRLFEKMLKTLESGSKDNRERQKVQEVRSRIQKTF